ncbi:MAG: MBL fold metallo-hydrolase [Halanaerobiales bacterium]
MSIKVSVLASGSSGNSILVSTDDRTILIDAGLSGKKIIERLKKCGIKENLLDAILVTHEHSDHIKGVGILSRKLDIPIYANELTWKESESCLGEIKKKNQKIFKNEFMIGNLGIIPFNISHDAEDPVGYLINYNDKKIGIATDMGYVTRKVKSRLKGLDFLILEANHDLEMLMTGSYPYYLKQRIKGDKGHLSNDATADLIPDLIGNKSLHILLAHLSKDNNRKELAYITIKNILEDQNLEIGKDLYLDFAYREKPTPVYEIS